MRGTIHAVARDDYRLFLGGHRAHAARVGSPRDQGSADAGPIAPRSRASGPRWRKDR